MTTKNSTTDDDNVTGGTEQIPRSVIERFIEEKKQYADFLETTAAPDGVASEVRDCAKELERVIDDV